MLALETGDEKTAFELLENLRAIEPSTIARTSAVENVNSFLKLAENEQAMRDWWRHSAKWWPKWVEFEREHLPARDEKVPLAPVIANLSELGNEMGEDSRAGRHDEALEALRVLGHAARWQPNMAMELCSVVSLGLPTLARIAEPFRELVISIHDEGGFTDPDHAGRVAIWAAVCHADGDTPQRAVQIARDFIREKGVKEEIGITLLRVWSLAAVKIGEKLEEPTETLVRHLASSTPDADRTRSVKALARLYQKQNLRDQELALLKKEVDDPRNKDGGDTLQQLRQRYELLQDGGAGGDGPALAVKAWLAAHKPAWYDHVRPLDLKDEKAAEPDEAMAPGNERSLTVPEAVKLCCLVASDPEQPDQRRHAAIHYLGWYAPSIATTEAEFKGWTAALQNEKSLPRPVRAFAVWLSARRSFWSDMHVPMQHALAQPILDHLRGDQQLAELAIVRRYARVSPTDLDGTDKLAAELLKGTLQYMTLEALQRCIQRLAENGRVEAARKHYKAMSTARYDEDVADDKAAQQLAALKAINAAQKLKPAHDALKEWFLATPAVKELPGKAVPQPFQPDWAPDLPDAERLQLYRQQVEQGRWSREDLSFWFDAAGALPRDARQVESCLGMFRIALEKAPDDETRAELIDDAGSIVDTDDPPTLARLEEVLKPWRGRADQPESQDALRLFDLHMRLRTGQETDLFATLATLQTPRRQAAARNAVLVALVSRGDKAGARRLLDQIDPDQLLGRGMIDDALHAYRLLGMKDELELATDQLRQHLEDDLLTAWMIPHGDTAGRVIHLALQLEDASLVPEAFSKHLRSTLRDPHEKHLFEAKDAYLRQDWPTAATAAARGIEVFPTLYDYHYFLGMSQARLGQKPEAIATLKTFLRYDHNSHQASQATQKLAELEK